MTTRRDILKSGAGLAAILATGKAPAYLVKSMLAARNSIGMRAGGAKLPYDSEVEYLESTGTQWIDTGISPDESDFGFYADGEYTTVSKSSSHGLYDSGVNYRAYFGIISQTKKFQFSTVTGNSNVVDADTSRHILGWEWKRNATHEVVGTIDGDVVYNSVVNELKTTPVSFVVFARHLSYGRCVNYAYFKCYSFKIVKDGKVVFNANPVRFTNELGQSEGAMYDRVNPTVGMNRDGTPRDDGLYLNRGTGAFLWGLDASAGIGGGGYNLICVWRAYTRSSRPSARFWRAAA